MTKITTSDSTQICENILRSDKAYNIEHSILTSENRIIDRLLGRRTELIDAYAEICRKLDDRPGGVRTMLGIVTCVAAFWSPEKVAEASDARERLSEVNREIASLANSLANLMEERTRIGNNSGFASDAFYHIVDVIDAAAGESGRYSYHLRDPLAALTVRYDLKYWPKLDEIVREIGHDASRAVLYATDPLTDAATTGSRRSRADFFKALFESIRENGDANHPFIPRNFKLTDSTLASLANCALNLGPDDLVDSAYVKRLRQRQRTGSGV